MKRYWIAKRCFANLRFRSWHNLLNSKGSITLQEYKRVKENYEQFL